MSRLSRLTTEQDCGECRRDDRRRLPQFPHVMPLRLLKEQLVRMVRRPAVGARRTRSHTSPASIATTRSGKRQWLLWRSTASNWTGKLTCGTELVDLLDADVSASPFPTSP